MNIIFTENRNKTYFKTAQTYIEENYAGQITLEDVAARLSLSPEDLNSLFKMSTGITLPEYIHRFRMEKAKEFLKNPTLKIYEIPFLVGYPDPVHFNCLFKEMFGVSPAEYRENLSPTE